jgi:hypothetical protein
MMFRRKAPRESQSGELARAGVEQLYKQVADKHHHLHYRSI